MCERERASERECVSVPRVCAMNNMSVYMCVVLQESAEHSWRESEETADGTRG